MAGIPSHTKSSATKRGAGSAREKSKNTQSGQRKSSGSSSGNQQKEEPSESPNSPGEAVSVEDSSSDFLFITTSKPSAFKNPSVQKQISRHVMKDYQNKQSKEATKRQGDREPGVNLTNTPSSHNSARASSDFTIGGYNMFHPSALDSSVLTQEMIYPLNIDLSSLDFQQRLGHLLSRYMSVWFGEQATRLCGGGSHNAWEQWLPDEVENDTLLYAQAFAAVTHINFLNPEAYRSERWNLKAQAIKVIRETLKHQETPHVDGNIGAVLCMAVVAPLDYDSLRNFVTHMNGLQKMILIRGGLRALRSNRMLHDALCLCDLSGAIIFRRNPVLVAPSDLEADGIADDLFDSPLGRCDDPTEPQRQPNLSSDSIQTLNDLYQLTRAWNAANYSRADLKDSPFSNRCASIERRLTQDPSHSAAAAPSQGPPHQVRESCRLAGLVYFRALFYNIPFSSPENIVIMQRLRVALENSILSGWSGAPGLLLWALLVGTAAARSKNDETFFAGHLSTTCFCLVANWHDVHQMLATFLRMELTVENKAAVS